MSQREHLQAALAAPMALEAAMGRAGVEGMLKGKRCRCLGQSGQSQLPAAGMHPSGCRRVILGAELLQGGVAKRRVVL